MRRMMLLVVSTAVAGLLTVAPAAFAGKAAVSFTPIGTVSTPVPFAATIDPYDQQHAFSISDLGLPQVNIYHLNVDGPPSLEDTIDLPDGVTPSHLWWDYDGFLIIETREGRQFEYCPDCDDFREIDPVVGTPIIAGAAAGYRVNVLSDYGGPGGGALDWSTGLEFENRLLLPGTNPGPIEFASGLAKLHGNAISGTFLDLTENSGKLVEFTDTAPPAEGETFNGPQGVHPAWLSVSPLNLTPSFKGPATHPVFVSSPALDGNVYWTPWNAGGPTGEWMQLSPTPLGQPTVIDFECEWGIVADYSNDSLTAFKVDLPKAAECEDAMDLLVKVAPKRELTLSESMKAFVNAKGDLNAFFHVRNRKAGGTIRAHAKVKVKAGKVTKAKLEFSRSATDAVQDALADGGKLKGATTFKGKTKARDRIKVRKPLTLRVSR